jgi:amino-acid N-acetyltransferase
MGTASLSLRRADGEAMAYVETLLERNGLPSSALRATPGRFYVGYHGDSRVGIGGIERYGTDGLLRSVVIARAARGNGFGRALCEALERRAHADGVETLYLLTTTAADFFEALDYEAIERAAAPETIRQTTEFADICPSTATCMRKRLR